MDNDNGITHAVYRKVCAIFIKEQITLPTHVSQSSSDGFNV